MHSTPTPGHARASTISELEREPEADTVWHGNEEMEKGGGKTGKTHPIERRNAATATAHGTGPPPPSGMRGRRPSNGNQTRIMPSGKSL